MNKNRNSGDYNDPCKSFHKEPVGGYPTKKNHDSHDPRFSFPEIWIMSKTKIPEKDLHWELDGI